MKLIAMGNGWALFTRMVPKAHTSILLSPFKRVSLKQRLLVLNAYPCTGQVKASGLHGTVVAFLGTVCL